MYDRPEPELRQVASGLNGLLKSHTMKMTAEEAQPSMEISVTNGVGILVCCTIITSLFVAVLVREYRRCS